MNIYRNGNDLQVVRGIEKFQAQGLTPVKKANPELPN